MKYAISLGEKNFIKPGNRGLQDDSDLAASIKKAIDYKKLNRVPMPVWVWLVNDFGRPIRPVRRVDWSNLHGAATVSMVSKREWRRMMAAELT